MVIQVQILAYQVPHGEKIGIRCSLLRISRVVAECLDAIPELVEGKPTTKAAPEDAAHFLVRMVHRYPSEVTIYEGGPMTDLALAISIVPHFAELAQGLVFMGGSISPHTGDAEFVNNPRHEFNFWLDPEAAHIVLRAPSKKIVCTGPHQLRSGQSDTSLARCPSRYLETTPVWSG